MAPSGLRHPLVRLNWILRGAWDSSVMSASEVMKLTPSTCALDGCGKPAHARGYCQVCYYRLRRHGELGLVAPIKWRHRITEVDHEARTGTCAECGVGVRLIKRGTGTGGWRCYDVTRIRSKEWKAQRRAELRVGMVDHCEICGAMDKLRWDHKHGTSHYRGTLCDLCNKGIGMFRDDPELLLQAMSYLAR